MNSIEVPAGAELTFRSTDALDKMFDHDVQISFATEPEGVIRFENVNFHQLTPASRKRLDPLVRKGRVEIGPGCIKYRLQTEVRTVQVQPGNAALVLEICQTFASYFTAGNGLNLGFEVVERGQEQVRFFYFSDENITEEEFRERLRHTEQDLWNLLSIQSTGQLLALSAAPGGEGEPSPVRERGILNAIDGMTALIGTFFRVGARIAVGSWKERDTRALLGAIRFNEDGAEQRVRGLHAVLVEKYTGRTLVDLNARQNQPLPPTAGIPERRALPPAAEKTRILFLGANFTGVPLALDQEIRAIQDDLKRARERDRLELKQEWAVTVDTLMRAMIDEAPHIVHFSGHAEVSGILLLDDDGRPKRIEEEALAGLFEACRDSVRCVVLSACYSERQARAIRRHVPHVIGMRSSVPDRASIAFSAGFYRALGGGWDIPRAFEMGKVAIALEGVGGADVPVLL